MTDTPGLPRPVQLGTAHYLDGDTLRTAPIYEPSEATNNQRIQSEDIGPGWVFVREELFDFTPAPKTAEERIADAATALAAIDTLSAPVLNDDIREVLADVRTALEG